MKDLQEVALLVKALADPTRVRIVAMLAGGELCVCHIHGALKLPQPLVSRHLAYLRHSGVVESRKNEQWVYYRLAPQRTDVIQTLLDACCHCFGHLSTTARDAAQLAKQTGCCASDLAPPTFRCCPVPLTNSESRWPGLALPRRNGRPNSVPE
jgi:ArsR family transcriptional regulator